MKPIVLRYHINNQSKIKSQNSSRSLGSTVDSFHQLKSSRSEIDISNEEKSQYYFPLNKSDFSSSFNRNADSLDKSTTLRHLSNWDKEILFKRNISVGEVFCFYQSITLTVTASGETLHRKRSPSLYTSEAGC